MTCLRDNMRLYHSMRCSSLLIFFGLFLFFFAQCGHALPVSARLVSISSTQSEVDSEPSFNEEFPNLMEVQNVNDEAIAFAGLIQSPPVVDFLKDASFANLRVTLPIMDSDHPRLQDVLREFENTYLNNKSFQKSDGKVQQNNIVDLHALSGDKLALGTARKRMAEVVRICIYAKDLIRGFPNMFPIIVKTKDGIFRIQRHFNGQCVGAAEKGEGGNGTQQKPYTFTSALTYKEMKKANVAYAGLRNNMAIFERARGDKGALLLAKVPALVHGKGSAAKIRIVDDVSSIVDDTEAIKQYYIRTKPNSRSVLWETMNYAKRVLETPYQPPDRDDSESDSERKRKVRTVELETDPKRLRQEVQEVEEEEGKKANKGRKKKGRK